jgi:hypothetical protein
VAAAFHERGRRGRSECNEEVDPCGDRSNRETAGPARRMPMWLTCQPRTEGGQGSRVSAVHCSHIASDDESHPWARLDGQRLTPTWIIFL